MIQTTGPRCVTFVPMRQLAVATFVVCALMPMVHGRAPELAWPQFRGPQGDKYVELAKNSMDEMSFASPALAPDTLFIHTQTRLYRSGHR